MDSITDQLDAIVTLHKASGDDSEYARGIATIAANASAAMTNQSARIADLEADNARLREALEVIADRHIGDCPQALGGISDEEWVRRCYAGLRRTARAALDARHEG